MDGLFVTIDGVDGVGKSTLIVEVAERLARADVPVRAIRLPGATAVGEALREVFLSDGFDALPLSEALLLYANFHEAHAKLAAPLRAAGYVVLADRFYDSCAVYQGRDPHTAKVLNCLQDLIFPGPTADLRFIVDAPASVCLTRLGSRQAADRFDRSQLGDLETRRGAYLDRAGHGSPRAIIIDNSGPLDAAATRIVDAIVSRRARPNSEFTGCS